MCTDRPTSILRRQYSELHSATEDNTDGAAASSLAAHQRYSRSVSVYSTGGPRKTFHVVNYGPVEEAPLPSTPSEPELSDTVPPATSTVLGGDKLNNNRDANDNDNHDRISFSLEPNVRGERFRESSRHLTHLLRLRSVHHEDLNEVIALPTRLPIIVDDEKTPPLLSSINPISNQTSHKWENKHEFNAVAKRGRLFAKRNKNRFVCKDGSASLAVTGVPKRGARARYLNDIFTTMLELTWGAHVTLFAISFLLTWFIFALAWWSISILHDDPQHRNDTQWVPCAQGVYDFTTALLFSIETQQTIGYGTRATTAECATGVWLSMTQSLVGVLIQCIMSGLTFAKLARPKKRSYTINFSKCAVICEMNGELYLQCRVSDLRRSHLVSINIKVILLEHGSLAQRDGLPFVQRDLPVHADLHNSDVFFFAWPLNVFHRIDKDSPLWDLSAESLLTASFEVVVIFEGVSQETGMITQVKTSYLPAEIMWGHRFAPIVKKRRENGIFVIDYSNFNVTIPTDMADESASQRKTTTST